MILLAKNILPSKFWIIEAADKTKKGTIQVADNGTAKVMLDGKPAVFPSFDQALADLQIAASEAPLADLEPKILDDYSVAGYPTKDKPYNEIYNAKEHLPMYTKTEKSKCFYSAGYYIIHFDFGWAPAFCPKVITLKRNEHRGPYKTRLEMKEQLRLANLRK